MPYLHANFTACIVLLNSLCIIRKSDRMQGHFGQQINFFFVDTPCVDPLIKIYVSRLTI
jgi:hypothetical protein